MYTRKKKVAGDINVVQRTNLFYNHVMIHVLHDCAAISWKLVIKDGIIFKFNVDVLFVTGRGGASIFGKNFEDELHPELKFTGNPS